MSRREDILGIFRQNEAYVKDRVNTGIETNRKGWNKLTFVDEAGNPVTDVHYTVRQKTHDFKFGCTLFLLDELETEEKNREYRRVFADTFNMGVAPFYWADLEPEKGKPRYAADSPKVYRRPAPDLCVDYCRENNIFLKGHCIVYDAFAPKWLPREIPAIKEAYDAHFAELAARYGKAVKQWDVINETLDWNVYGHGRVTPFFREPDYVDWSFHTARRHLPTQQLFINEAGGLWDQAFQFNRTQYYMQLETLKYRGVPYDCIGIQAHSFFRREDELKGSQYRYDPMRVLDALELYGSFGKPLQISEVTLPAYSDDPEDEEIQAEILKNLYPLWFSSKMMDGIVYWNMADGYTYGAAPGDLNSGENYFRGGLLHFDLSEKPVMRELKKLIRETWHTETEGSTGALNEVSFKGFYGKYDVTAVHDGHETKAEIHLDKRMDMEHRIVLK